MSRRLFLGGAVAASAALVLLQPPLQLWPGLSAMAADYRTATGEQRELPLAPNITVQMNTQTALNVQSRNGSPVGISLLSGEIQVQVLDGATAPFTVRAGDGKVRAMAGSQCNVRCLDGDVDVVGLTGTLHLTYRGHSQMLAMAERAHYGQAGLERPRAADVEQVMAWRRRVLVFDDRPLAEVVEEINRYRPGRLIITDDALAGRHVRARFSLNQLTDVAALMHDAVGARVTTLPGGIVLLG